MPTHRLYGLACYPWDQILRSFLTSKYSGKLDKNGVYEQKLAAAKAEQELSQSCFSAGHASHSLYLDPRHKREDFDPARLGWHRNAKSVTSSSKKSPIINTKWACNNSTMPTFVPVTLFWTQEHFCFNNSWWISYISMFKLRGVKYHLLSCKISSIPRFFIISNIFNLLKFWITYYFWSLSSTKRKEQQRKSSFAVSLFENLSIEVIWQGHFLRGFGSFSNYFTTASKWQSQAQLWKKSYELLAWHAITRTPVRTPADMWWGSLNFWLRWRVSWCGREIHLN